MEKDKTPRVKLLVLNDFLTFDRKIYQVLGLNLPRPIKIKAIIFFVLAGGIELIVYFTPVIGRLISWIPFVYLLAIPICIAYLLSDVRTEGRNSLAFFRSIFLYHMRKRRKVTYERGREIAKPRNYRFQGIATITFYEDKLHNERALKLQKELSQTELVAKKKNQHFIDKSTNTSVKEKNYQKPDQGGKSKDEGRYLRLPY